MNYVQARSIFFTERAREVLAFMKSKPDAHHIVIMPTFSMRDGMKDVFDRQRCFKERVPYCAPDAGIEKRRAYVEQLNTWVGTPHESGYSMISSMWANGGWRVRPHPDTEVYLSWVSTITPDPDSTIDDQSRYVEQTLARFIGLDGLVAKVGCLSKRQGFAFSQRKDK